MTRLLLVGGNLPQGAAIAARAPSAGFEVVQIDGRGGPAAVAERVRAAGPAAALAVNMAAAAGTERFLDVDDGAFEAALDGSVRLLHAAARAALPGLVEGAAEGRAVVAVVSRAYLGAWHAAHLAAAHAATIGMVRSLSLEWAPHGIRVNAAAPDLAGGKRDTQAARDAVADGVLHLLGPGGAAINGETVLMDGGGSLRMAESRRR